MSDEKTRADVYRLKGAGIELTYRRSDGRLDITGDDHLLNHDDLDARATVAPEIGLQVTATLLESSRAGTRVVLTLLLPEVSWPEATQEPEEVTGVAIVTSSFKDAVSGPPPVLQKHDDVRRLEGTASRGD